VRLALHFGKDRIVALLQDAAAILGAALIVGPCHDPILRCHRHRGRAKGPSLAGRLTAAGSKVALAERKLFGGTCLNTGCMPTKTL